jgi:hypothetical protein
VKEFVEWEEKDWDAVVFSDESKFNIFGSDGKRYCRRRNGDRYKERNVKKTVKHGGGSLMVWGCITRWGTGHLIRVVGNMDRFQFVKILKQGLLGTLRNYDMDPDGISFQQDGDSKHTSQHVMEFFESQGIDLLPWSGQSADINIIKPAWSHLDKQVRKQSPLPRNLDELWEALEEEWGRLDTAYIAKLYESIPRRLQAVKDAKGGYTKY